MLRILLTSLLAMGCQTKEIEPEPCPICQDPSIAEIEVCEIEKTEMEHRVDRCLDKLRALETKPKKRGKNAVRKTK